MGTGRGGAGRVAAAARSDTPRAWPGLRLAARRTLADLHLAILVFTPAFHHGSTPPLEGLVLRATWGPAGAPRRD